ncbi:uncharacterized protein LOC144714749 isoform X2 [Wolffia australiana]
MELSFCERAMAVFLGCLVCSPEVFLPLSRQNEERAVMINSNADEDRISNVKAALTFIAKATLKDITGKRAEEAQAFKEKSLSFRKLNDQKELWFAIYFIFLHEFSF